MSITLCTARSFYYYEACDFCEAKHKEAIRSLEQEGTLAVGWLCGRLVESKLVHGRSKGSEKPGRMTALSMVVENWLAAVEHGKM